MARGGKAQVGDTNVSANGYHYTRTASGWRLTHHIIAENKYKRKINIDMERVIFVDGDRTNLASDNIEIRPKRSSKSHASKRASLEAKIEELQAQLAALSEEQDE